VNFAAEHNRGLLTQHQQPGICADGYCTIKKWSGGLAEESWAASWGFQTKKFALKLCTQHPRLPEIICPGKGFVSSLCQFSAREVPWVGLGRRAGPPHPKTEICSTSSHTTPQGTIIHLVRYEVWLGAYDEFQPMGWPG